MPQLYADVDKAKALTKGVAVADIYAALQTFLGGSYVNDFSRFGRQWRVFLQAEASARMRAEDLAKLYVRSASGVELAKDSVARGTSALDAALEAARLRLRPILMTSFAFIFGCIPLWAATGAGSAARRVLGTAVISGMLAATLLGIFFIPALFVVIERITGGTRRATRS